MICHYCNQGAELVSGEVIHPHRPDLHNRHYWFCRPCDAYIQAASDGRALGVMADFDAREGRIEAHRALNELISGGVKKKEAMKLVLDEMHWPHTSIARMGPDDCREFVIAAKNVLDKRS